jgi:hypothetical protein
VTKFEASSQINHDRPDDSGTATNFSNELSCIFQSNGKSRLIKTRKDIRTPWDSLYVSDNGRSVDSFCVNDSVNEVSTKPNDDKKPMLTVTHDDIAISSDK